MSTTDFSIELKTDFNSGDLKFYTMLEDRLSQLSKGHTDITGAAATIREPAAHRETPYVFEATVVVYVRPNSVSVSEKRESPEVALKSALDSVERQVREQRNRLREDRGSLDDIWLSSEADSSDNE